MKFQRTWSLEKDEAGSMILWARLPQRVRALTSAVAAVVFGVLLWQCGVASGIANSGERAVMVLAVLALMFPMLYTFLSLMTERGEVLE